MRPMKMLCCFFNKLLFVPIAKQFLLSLVHHFISILLTVNEPQMKWAKSTFQQRESLQMYQI